MPDRQSPETRDIPGLAERREAVPWGLGGDRFTVDRRLESVATHARRQDEHGRESRGESSFPRPVHLKKSVSPAPTACGRLHEGGLRENAVLLIVEATSGTLRSIDVLAAHVLEVASEGKRSVDSSWENVVRCLGARSRPGRGFRHRALVGVELIRPVNTTKVMPHKRRAPKRLNGREVY